MTVVVEFQPEGKRVHVEKGSTILEAARLGGIRIRSVCGGRGTCGKCKVIVEEGPISEEEMPRRKFIDQDEASKGFHLACQAKTMGDVRVTIPPESRIEGQQILASAILPRVEFDPCCLKRFLSITPAMTKDKMTQVSRLSMLIADALGGNPFMSDQARLKLEELPDNIEGVTITVDRSPAGIELIDIAPGDTTHRNYGLALDIGTTKAVGYLVDLKDGRIVAAESGYNEQLIYGEDLLSRIDYAFRHRDGLSRLCNAVVATVNKILEALCANNHLDPKEIASICAAGNTVMTYILAGIDPSPLVEANVKVSRRPIRRKARELKIIANPDAPLYCLPSVSRFLGGDAVGDVLVSGMHEAPQVSVLIDMGTNCEIIMGSGGWLLSTSCAAGPAFEGWEIKFGMRSVNGAIEHVKIDRATFKSSYTLVGGANCKARGICGSGVIDALAEMYRSGLVDSFGKIRDEGVTPLVREGPEGPEYVISPASENELGKDIVITQKDIDNIMDSKAAVCGSVAVLMKKTGVTIKDVGNLYLAGAFGSYVDPDSAIVIGVFPEFLNAKIVQIGNGSVAGAYLTLLSIGKRREAEQIAQTMTYYDLTADPDFMEEYSAALSIPGKPELFPSRRR